ncbi:MAG: hypothetical protein ABSH50_11445 [Bryobacteraceae bacterium]|jgi:hypothetical protein
MNDTELDKLLDRWTAPSAPASLRASVRAGFAEERRLAGHPRRASKRWLWAAFAGAVAILLVAALARPGAAAVRIPYLVDSEFLRYADGGTATIEMYTSSYALNGTEILESRSIPDRPFATVIGRSLDATLPLWSRLMARLTFDAQTVERVRQAAHRSVGAITGCAGSCLVLEQYGFARGTACLDGTIVDHETILNYPTTGVQPRMGGSIRMTWWMAPELGCFALRITTEEKQPDGTWRLVREKRALRIGKLL